LIIRDLDSNMLQRNKEQEAEHLKETLQRCLFFLKEKSIMLTEARKSISSLDLIIAELKVCKITTASTCLHTVHKYAVLYKYSM
jgi:hypothetical protein